MKFTNLFAINLEGEDKENFKRSMMKENILRAKLSAKLLIGFDSILVVVDIITSVLRVSSEFHFDHYLMMYMLMILSNITILLLISRSDDLENKSIGYINNCEKVMILYITVMMTWGSIISLMDQKLYGQLMVFMVNMIVCSVLYYVENEKIFIPYVISTSILLFCLPLFQSSTDILIGHYVNLIIFLIISLFCSRVLYHNYYNNFISKTLLRNANNKLQELSLVDELTGIPNRRSFNNYITFLSSCNLKHDAVISVIMIDIDFFKQYNDNYGHSAGDKIIKKVAHHINSIATAQMNFAARLGGEEFIYMANEVDKVNIRIIAEKIRTEIINLKLPHKYSKISEFISISLGTSTIRFNTGEDIFHCVELADKALYLAKSSNRNCVRSIH